MSLAVGTKVLVTGSTGMLGSHIKSALKSRNLSALTPSRSELDLMDPKKTFEYLKKNKIDTVIHCAARVGGIAANIAFPADFIGDNLQVDTSVLSNARKLKIPNLIYFGSSCMYPINIDKPIKENSILSGPLEPTNESYALAKITAARYIQAVSIQDKLNWRVLIPSNLYGPNDNFDGTNGHLIPAVISKIYNAKLKNEKIIEIWGDGKSRREFTYVGDVASFISENLSSIKSWPILMNVGIGQDYTIDEYYKIIAQELNFYGSFVYDLGKPSGIKRKLMDSSVARKFGWSPKVGIVEGIGITVDWFLGRLSLE